jgi:hypothetical protein
VTKAVHNDILYRTKVSSLLTNDKVDPNQGGNDNLSSSWPHLQNVSSCLMDVVLTDFASLQSFVGKKRSW